MDRIASFSIDHTRLEPGLYVSRIDLAGETPVTTFDIRMTRPNIEPAMSTAGIHTLEHLGATYLRNEPDWKRSVIYFGPMGCRTGFYLVLSGEHTPQEILPLIDEMFDFVTKFDGAIPGASATECGNYLDMNLAQAKYYAEKYRREFLSAKAPAQMTYPE